MSVGLFGCCRLKVVSGCGAMEGESRKFAGSGMDCRGRQGRAGQVGWRVLGFAVLHGGGYE